MKALTKQKEKKIKAAHCTSWLILKNIYKACKYDD